jgi:hypothetical protein
MWRGHLRALRFDFKRAHLEGEGACGPLGQPGVVEREGRGGVGCLETEHGIGDGGDRGEYQKARGVGGGAEWDGERGRCKVAREEC